MVGEYFLVLFWVCSVGEKENVVVRWSTEMCVFFVFIVLCITDVISIFSKSSTADLFEFDTIWPFVNDKSSNVGSGIRIDFVFELNHIKQVSKSQMCLYNVWKKSRN